MRRTALALWFVILATIAGAQNAEKQVRYIQVRYIMGAPCAIEIYSDHDASGAMDAAFAELHRIDALLSNWKSDSDLMKLNRAAGAPGQARPWVSVNEELFQRVQVALRVAEASDGRFDPTVGPLVRAYGFLPSNSKVESIAEARVRVGWRKVKLGAKLGAVQFAVAGMEIDLGGIAKGYAAGRAADVLRQQGITSALVSLGGSSVTAIGSPPAERGWMISIRDPRDGTTAAATIELHDGESLGTSGTYENTKGEGKARVSHIIDPRRGRAITGFASVTVVLDDAEIADGLTKPFLLEPCCSRADWAKWLASYENASIILLQARRGELRRITGGAHPERFGAAGTDSDGDVAKANRRSAQHLARDGPRGAGHSAYTPEAGGAKAHGAARYDSTDVSGDSRAPVD